VSAVLLCPDLVIAGADDPAPRRAAILVENERIVAIGDAAALSRTAERIELPGQVLLPGLVNAHQHGRGISNIQLGYADDILERWLFDKRRRRPMDPYANTLLAAAQMIASGVTSTIQANSPYGSGDYGSEIRATIRAYDESGMRAMVGVAAIDRAELVYPAEAEAELRAQLPAALAATLSAAQAPTYAGGIAETIALMAALRGELAGHPRLGLAYSPAGPQWVSDDMLRALADDARAHELPFHMHCLESLSQANSLQDIYPEGVMRRLDSLGVLGPGTSLAHAVWLSHDDVALAAERGVVLVSNPASNLRLRAGIAPVRDYLNAGVPVAIGTDNTALADDEDLLGELRLSWRLAGDPAWSAPRPPDPPTLLRMATANGARAMGLADDIGVIAPGRLADVIALDLRRIAGAYRDPDMPLLTAIMARGGARDVTFTMVGGRVLYRDRQFTTLDLAAVAARAAASAAETAVSLDAFVNGAGGALAQVIDAHYAARHARVGTPPWRPIAPHE